MKTYVTFGQIHVHSVDGQTYDKDCVAVIDCVDRFDGRRLAVFFFGPKYCFEYFEDDFNMDDLDKFYPRGLIPVNFTVDESTEESATPQKSE